MTRSGEMNARDLAVPIRTPRSSLARRAAGWLNDPRDLVFLELMLVCALVASAGVALFFVPTRWLVVAAPLYWLVWGFGVLDRFTLMLHCTSHRPLFAARRVRWNQLVPCVLGPFFGQAPLTYFAHHMGMHHPENNLARDLSSTLPHRRDRLSHWLRYFASFMVFGLWELAAYHRARRNRRLFWKTVGGELSFWALAGGSAMVNGWAALVVFVVPFVAVRALMMAGNWGQHAFVDATDAANPYRNSITCINTRYNRRCFHDGYHTHHHEKPRTHWSDYPSEFARNVAEYARQDAIVFDGIDFFQVWLGLMLGRWGMLADHFVSLPGAPERDHAEVIALLQSRAGMRDGPRA